MSSRKQERRTATAEGKQAASKRAASEQVTPRHAHTCKGTFLCACCSTGLCADMDSHACDGCNILFCSECRPGHACPGCDGRVSQCRDCDSVIGEGCGCGHSTRLGQPGCATCANACEDCCIACDSCEARTCSFCRVLAGRCPECPAAPVVKRTAGAVAAAVAAQRP